jgi:hypothetical protein
MVVLCNKNKRILDLISLALLNLCLLPFKMTVCINAVTYQHMLLLCSLMLLSNQNEK